MRCVKSLRDQQNLKNSNEFIWHAVVKVTQITLFVFQMRDVQIH